MTDIVAAKQVVRGVIRLEMTHHGLLDCFGKQGLVAVQEGCAGLGNGLLHRIDSVGGQHVVVVRQRQILPGGQRRRAVGVVADTTVLNCPVADALARLFGGGVHHSFHLRPMRLIRSIRQTQFPAGAGLIQHAVQQLTQKRLRGIVQRHADGDHRPGHALRAFLALGFQYLLFGQIAGLLAEKAPLDEPGGPAQHRAGSFLLQHLKSVAHQFFDPFQFQIQWRFLSFDLFGICCSRVLISGHSFQTAG